MSNWLDPKAVNIARLLKEAGYATAHVGKWHLGSGEGAPSPKEYGFDFVRATTSNDDTWKEQNSDPYFRAKSSRLFVDEAVKFIESNKEKPFYLSIVDAGAARDVKPDGGAAEAVCERRPRRQGLPAQGREADLLRTVTDLDTQVGRLIAKLDGLKLADNTLVVFSSDNGPEEITIRNAGHAAVGSPGPFRGRKRSLYEGGIRLPFIVRMAGYRAGGASG